MSFARRKSAFLLKVRQLLYRDRAERELDEELQFHIDAQVAEAVARGEDEGRARRASMLAMDSLQRRKEECRDARGFRALEEIWRTLRFALRGLRRNPGHTAAAALTLALGIGSSTAVFSLLDVAMFQPLPWRDPDRLVVISQNLTFGAKRFENAPVSAAHWQEWLRSGQSMESVTLLQQQMRFAAVDDGAPERVRQTRVTPGFFEMLGIAPMLGRGFVASDGESGNEVIAVVSHSFWRDRMHGNAGAVGKKIVVDGRPFEVVGVMPPSFYFPKDNELNYAFALADGVDFWSPNVMGERAFNPSAEFNYVAIGRIAPHVSVEAAHADLNRISLALLASVNSSVKASVNLVPVAVATQSGVRDALLLLSCAVFAVLLICCVNVANLLFARALIRRKEQAVRTALGASRLRLLGEMLGESIVLALGGGIAGVVTAHWFLQAQVVLAETGIPRLAEAGIHPRVLGFSLAVTVFAALLAGGIPAWKFSRVDPQEGLRQNCGNAADPVARRVRDLLVTAQVALCVILLVIAGLLARSFSQLVAAEKGFNPERVVTLSFELPPGGYETEEHRRAAFRELFGRLERVPGVAAVGGVSQLPMRPESSINGMWPEGDAPRPWTEQLTANYRVATSGYFAAAGIPLRAGRIFQDTDADLDTAVISRNAAERLWPGSNPIGRRLRRNGEGDWIRVVGVVSDVRQAGLDRDAPMIVYRPNAGMNGCSIAVRTTVSVAGAAEAIRGAIRGFERGSRLGPMQTMEELVAATTGRRRLQAGIVAVFALSALVLASFGIFGVVSYATAQRRGEIGLRMALGATRRDVIGLVLQQGLVPVAVGVGVGLGGALTAARAMRGLLFGVPPADLPSFFGSVGLLAMVAVLACWVPAWRASGIDPQEALRID